MADDRMKNDDLDRNMGGAGQAGQKDMHSQQSAGRKQDDDLSMGQRGTSQKNQPGHMDDEFGSSQKSGTGQGQQGGRQGGQNR